jgi:DNA-directed RNA polymerase subunit beta
VWLTLEVQRLPKARHETHTVLLGEIPLLTGRDTLIIRGVERVPVAQLLLYPGVYFERKERSQYDARHERRDHVLTWTASLRPQWGAHLRISITGEGDAASARVAIGRRTTYALREALEQLDVHARVQEVLGSNRLFQRLTHQEGEGTMRPEDSVFWRTHFFTPNEAYALSARGRERLNAKLEGCATTHGLILGSAGHLTPDDVIAMLVYLCGLAQPGQEPGVYEIDDLNHLKHRRLVLLGDRLEAAFQEAIAGTLSPLIDTGLEAEDDLEYIFSSVRGVFGATIEQCFQGQGAESLYQMLDQTNPLAEVSHKRKVTFRGPGGVRSKYGSLSPESPRRGLASESRAAVRDAPRLGCTRARLYVHRRTVSAYSPGEVYKPGKKSTGGAPPRRQPDRSGSSGATPRVGQSACYRAA